MDLVREMLLAVADADGPLDCSVFVDSRRGFPFVAEHARLMDEAGLVEARFAPPGALNPARATIVRMTWDGNDFLDAVSNEKVWNRVKLKVAQLAGHLTFETLKALAVAELNAMVLPPVTLIGRRAKTSRHGPETMRNCYAPTGAPFVSGGSAMAEAASIRERECERIAATLRFVADHIDRYIPEEVCLEGTRLVVRVPDASELPTVELDATMPAQIVWKRTQ